MVNGRQHPSAGGSPLSNDNDQRLAGRRPAGYADTDLTRLQDELFGFQYIMRAFVVIGLPVLVGLTLYNLLQARHLETVMVGAMAALVAWSYRGIRRSDSQAAGLQTQYRLYQNTIRGFLFVFTCYLLYATGWKGEVDRVHWTYVFPIVAFFALGMREGAFWALGFLASLSLAIFRPDPQIVPQLDMLGFKVRYVLSFTVVCAVGFAGAKAIQLIYDRLLRRQAQLIESEENYRLLFENSVDVIYALDAQLRVVDVSPSVEKALGYRPAEVIGRPIHELGVLAPESMDDAFADTMTVLGGTAVPSAFYTFVAKDGTKRFAEVSGAPIRRNGQVVGLISIGRDITERKRAEDEKKRLEAQLQHAHKMDAIGTLAGGLAHDFNNILMAIQGRASLMLLDMDPAQPNWRHLKEIEDCVLSAAGLTRQLLGFARGGKYEVKPTDLNALVEASASLFGRTRKEIVINKTFQADLWTAEVDRGQIEQVMLNLLVNAWQAMPAGGDLCLNTDNVVLGSAEAQPHDVAPGPFVRIAVTDSGAGMDEPTRQRLFEPFFTTKAMGRGTGLGLASAYGIIKNHGGFITVESQKGRGTTFSLFLPASAKPVSPGKAPDSVLLQGQGTLLLVDDEDIVLEVGALMLERLGYEVLKARSGQEALQLYDQHRDRIRMVILDMVMPQMSGEAVFDRLKAIDPTVKVLLSSGYSIDSQAQQILARGCNGFVQKPFTLSDFSSRVKAVLESG